MTSQWPLPREEHYDIVIIGAGLAGLSLARQLSMMSDKTILVLERQAQIPPDRQKVGESLVQVGGYYFSKVLDLEEYLLGEHYMKYNLRFYWKNAAGGTTASRTTLRRIFARFQTSPAISWTATRSKANCFAATSTIRASPFARPSML